MALGRAPNPFKKWNDTSNSNNFIPEDMSLISLINFPFPIFTLTVQSDKYRGRTFLMTKDARKKEGYAACAGALSCIKIN